MDTDDYKIVSESLIFNNLAIRISANILKLILQAAQITDDVITSHFLCVPSIDRLTIPIKYKALPFLLGNNI